MATVKSHGALLALLQAKVHARKSITLTEILNATGWKASTFRTYWNKGQLSPFLNDHGDNSFTASNVTRLTGAEFTRFLSQSKHRRELGHICKSRLAKALLRKSRENMLLALELYNRPSLDNRLDAFMFCFCTAWEQLLKAKLIEETGESSIFKPRSQKKGRTRDTISLRECLNRQYHKDDFVRRNVERIVDYRDQAVHLLMPEIQGPVSRLLQSGVTNYTELFEAFARQSMLEFSHAGLMSLVGDFRSPDHAMLKSRYGDTVGDEIANLIDELAAETKATDDIRFAIPIDVRLVFSKKDAKGNSILLSNADEGMEGLKKAVVVEKPVDRDRTHPHRQNDSIKEINTRLNERHQPQDLETMLPSRDKATSKPCINAYDFQAGILKLKWKSGNNQHHYKSKNPVCHYYSELAIYDFVTAVENDEAFLTKARKSHGHRPRKP